MTLTELLKQLYQITGCEIAISVWSSLFQVSVYSAGYQPGDIVTPATGEGWELDARWVLELPDVMEGIKDLTRGPSLVFLMWYDRLYRTKHQQVLTLEGLLDITQVLSTTGFPAAHFNEQDPIYIFNEGE